MDATIAGVRDGEFPEYRRDNQSIRRLIRASTLTGRPLEY